MDTMKRLEAEAKILNLINRLADCFNVKVVNTDTEKHIVHFNGEQADCDAFARKLCEIFVEDTAEEIASVPVQFIA